MWLQSDGSWGWNTPKAQPSIPAPGQRWPEAGLSWDMAWQAPGSGRRLSGLLPTEFFHHGHSTPRCGGSREHRQNLQAIWGFGQDLAQPHFCPISQHQPRCIEGMSMGGRESQEVRFTGASLKTMSQVPSRGDQSCPSPSPPHLLQESEKRIVQELLETEQAYVARLHLLDQASG